MFAVVRMYSRLLHLDTLEHRTHHIPVADFFADRPAVVYDPPHNRLDNLHRRNNIHVVAYGYVMVFAEPGVLVVPGL